MMVTPIAAEILEVAIPFRLTFRHALAARSAGSSVIVRLVDEHGHTGFGECAPREYVSGESLATVTAALQEMLPAFLCRSQATLAQAADELAAFARALPRHAHAAFCALELALLDLVGKALGTSSGSVLGPVVLPRLHYSGVVSADGVEGVQKICVQMRALGLRSVKLKVGGPLAEDLALLHAARAALGDDCALRVDANCAWTAAQALERVAAFAPFRLDGLEQPVAADDLAGMQQLTARSAIPIIADEALVSVQDAERLAGSRACHVFNIRISKCGGLLNARRIHAIGRDAGIGFVLGAQVGESALLSAAGRQFATRVPGVLHCEGSFGTLLLAEDIARADVTFGAGGVAPALDGPGLGVEVDEARLRAHCKRVTPVPGR